MFEKFSITPCDIADIVSETNRFLFHITLVHVVSCIIDPKEEFLGSQVIKTLFITALAIILYHILCKKIVEPKLKSIRSVCEDKTPKQKQPKSSNDKKRKRKDDDETD